MNRKKTLAYAVPVAVLLVAAIAWPLARRTRSGDAPGYDTATVSRGRVSSAVTATGTLSALVTVEVGSQVSGRVQSISADFNARVKKGQVVARIDPSLFETQVAQARANEQAAVAGLQGAQATAAEAKRQYDRVAGLVQRDMAAQAEADTALAALQSAEANLAEAKAKIAQARAARAQAETNLAYTTITSPIDGIVISREVDVGQTVASSLQAPKLFTIAEDLRKMEVHTDVAESDVGRVRQGMPVQFTVDAFPGEHFRGVVKEVRYAPKTVQNVVTYDAVVSVDNSELKLRPGMTADVSFVVEDVDDALVVPNAALRFRPPEVASAQKPGAAAARGADGGSRRGPAGGDPQRGGDRARGSGGGARAEGGGDRAGGAGPATGGGAARRVVYKLGADGTLKPTPVRVGPSDGTRTAIVGGELAEGDEVVTGVAGAAKPTGNGRPGGSSGGPRRPGSFL